MWEFLGLGFTEEHRTEGADKSPYMNRSQIDPKWLMEQTKEGKALGEKLVKANGSAAATSNVPHPHSSIAANAGESKPDSEMERI